MPPLNKFAKSCVATALGHVLLSDPASAATVVVNNSGDGLNTCTLRSAVTTFNNAASVGGCVPVGSFGVNDTIEFQVPSPVINVSSFGAVEITRPGLSINGPGAGVLTILGDNSFYTPGVFTVNSASNVTLRDITINGFVTVTNSPNFRLENAVISGGESTGYGGGLFLGGSDASVVQSSEISGNSGYAGGGIAIVNSDAVMIDDCVISENTTTGESKTATGGGISIYDSDTVTISNSQISNNTGYHGGGISVINSDGVAINGTSISGNTAAGERYDGLYGTTNYLGKGGGVFFYGVNYYSPDRDTPGLERLTITNSTISANSAVSSGGGLNSYGIDYARKSTVSIIESRIGNNAARINGGIRIGSYHGENTISLSTIDSNISTAFGVGGISVGGYGSRLVVDQTTVSNNVGGGIAASSLSITNSTVSQNSSSGAGSGIRFSSSSYDAPASSTITNTTIADNRGPSAINLNIQGVNTLTFGANNVISGSSQANCSGNQFPTFGVSNWVDDVSCGQPNSGDPRLRELADNGGPTKTHAPMPGSGLIGAGSLSACSAAPVDGIDQRGEPRGTTSCFIGAVEGVVDPTSFFVIPLGNNKSVVIPL